MIEHFSLDFHAARDEWLACPGFPAFDKGILKDGFIAGDAFAASTATVSGSRSWIQLQDDLDAVLEDHNFLDKRFDDDADLSVVVPFKHIPGPHQPVDDISVGDVLGGVMLLEEADPFVDGIQLGLQGVCLLGQDVFIHGIFKIQIEGTIDLALKTSCPFGESCQLLGVVFLAGIQLGDQLHGHAHDGDVGEHDALELVKNIFLDGSPADHHVGAICLVAFSAYAGIGVVAFAAPAWLLAVAGIGEAAFPALDQPGQEIRGVVLAGTLAGSVLPVFELAGNLVKCILINNPGEGVLDPDFPLGSLGEHINPGEFFVEQEIADTVLTERPACLRQIAFFIEHVRDETIAMPGQEKLVYEPYGLCLALIYEIGPILRHIQAQRRDPSVVLGLEGVFLHPL